MATIDVVSARQAARPDASGDGRAAAGAVPWGTVLLLAVAMAYVDGFWTMSLRGAVGAIERTQTPFVSWLQESTLVLPLYVCAVLAAEAPLNCNLILAPGASADG